MSDYRLFKRGTESLPAEHQWLHRQLSGVAYTSFRSALLQLYSMLHTVFNVNITVVVPIFSLVRPMFMVAKSWEKVSKS